jgi:Cys-tRNA(Pro)/Cys-tRNA(Cys) deacylase
MAARDTPATTAARRAGVVPVEHELDLRSLGKRAKLADTTKAQRTTGYVAGGISPLGQRRALPTLVDDSALEHDTVFVSAGAGASRSSSRGTTSSPLTGADVRALRR